MGDRQVFIGNLCNVSSEVLRTYCEAYGSLTELSLNRDKENNVYHCFAFVTFQSTRSTSQFMSNRPHFINGKEVFVKRALPRSTSSIPERLIVTNRLILQDLHQHDKRFLRHYFQKFGPIKKFDIEHGFIDYEDYDDVDRVLLARPHYIRDKEISVTKFVPSDQHDTSDHHRHRLHTSYNHRHLHDIEQPDRIITTSTETMKVSCTKKLEQNSTDIAFIAQQTDEDDDESDDERIDGNYLNTKYEHLQEQYEEYKQSKEIEICALRLDLERTKRQLADLTQEKLDVLLKNQQLYHNELILRLFPDGTSMHTQTAEEFFRSTPTKLTKKRKVASPSSIYQEYEYYS